MLFTPNHFLKEKEMDKRVNLIKGVDVLWSVRQKDDAYNFVGGEKLSNSSSMLEDPEINCKELVGLSNRKQALLEMSHKKPRRQISIESKRLECEEREKLPKRNRGRMTLTKLKTHNDSKIVEEQRVTLVYKSMHPVAQIYGSPQKLGRQIKLRKIKGRQMRTKCVAESRRQSTDGVNYGNKLSL